MPVNTVSFQCLGRQARLDEFGLSETRLGDITSSYIVTSGYNGYRIYITGGEAIIIIMRRLLSMQFDRMIPSLPVWPTFTLSARSVFEPTIRIKGISLCPRIRGF